MRRCSRGAARTKRRTESTFAHSLGCLRFLNARKKGPSVRGGLSSCVSVRHGYAHSGIAIQSVVPMTTAGGKGVGGMGLQERGCCIHSANDTIHKLTHFEGLLCRLAGADGDEARPGHAAETLQMEPLQHRHGRHGIVLHGKNNSAEQEIENIVN